MLISGPVKDLSGPDPSFWPTDPAAGCLCYWINSLRHSSAMFVVGPDKGKCGTGFFIGPIWLIVEFGRSPAKKVGQRRQARYSYKELKLRSPRF